MDFTDKMHTNRNYEMVDIFSVHKMPFFSGKRSYRSAKGYKVGLRNRFYGV